MVPPKRPHGDSTSASHKKKKSGPSKDDVKSFYTSVLNLLLSLKDDNGDPITGPFLKLPPKKMYPDYYDIIESPISIAEIQKKVKQGKYSLTTTEEFLQDFELLKGNAAKYNDPESWIVAGANKIYDFVSEQSEEFFKNGPSVPAESKSSKAASKPVKEEAGEARKVTYDRLPSICTAILNEVIAHDFPEEGIISGPFIEDVDTDLYPDYTNFVANPTSFENVLKRIERKKLFSAKISLADNIERFYHATNLIFTNAQLYNDPSSDIHQDAETLKALFEEKYNVLKEEVTKLSKLRLKLKQPKVKLNLKLKGEDHKAPSTGPEVKQESNDGSNLPEDTSLDHGDDDSLGQVEVDTKIRNEHERETRGEIVTEKTTLNTLGKSLPTIQEDDAVIQEVSISTSTTAVNYITKHTQQKAQQSSNLPLPKNEEMKNALFPTHPLHPVTTFFEYKVPANGYAVQSYTLALPADVSPLVSFKISLHNLLYGVKESELIDGHGYLGHTTDDDFQCKLFVNESEVAGNECYEEEKNDGTSLLGLQYDLKLSYGLNMLEFEVKVAPSLSKLFKHSKPPEDSEELAGRHTRHQLQQLKMTWEVEKIVFFVVCNTT